MARTGSAARTGPRPGAVLGPRLLAAVLARPGLWAPAVRSALRLAPAGWYRRAPYLPLPPAAYLGFRLETMYGSPGRRPDPADLVRWLAWCRDQMVNRLPD